MSPFSFKPPLALLRHTAYHFICMLNSNIYIQPNIAPLLCYPVPKASDRTQIQSKEIRLTDSTLIRFRCSNSTNQEWVLFGRDPLEIFRLAVGLWYTERRNLITSLYTLFRAVLLDQGLEDDLVADIQKLLEDLLNSGLRQKLISLIKELNC
ncbi:hypothetical protein ZOSMA_499G00010 [Zostera marina]|uniref:Uncharacterized protein n=1 Tax=Zostera marina TaxID=29655 RepID=A0A0K9P1G9_ZOSMR|nr:hypothetical protein ZOSMA_499G00010 [Zostera marina]